jgi:hypothetical protein
LVTKKSLLLYFKKERIMKTKGVFIFSLILGFVSTNSVKGTLFVSVKNTDMIHSANLSDLIVYDKDGKGETILHPNNSSDDVTMVAQNIKKFEVKTLNNVASYFISERKGTKEIESKILKLKPAKPRKVAYANDLDDIVDLYLAIDDEIGVVGPSETMVYSFLDGINDSLIGWFIGTSIDFETGVISDPYTGDAEIIPSDLEITIVPEPAMVLLLSLGGLVVFSRRR